MNGSTDFRGYLASITEKLKSPRVSDISFYYYDLTKDSGFGIAEDVNYTPASLCKVQVMMAFLKMAEQNETLLNQKLTIPDSLKPDYSQDIAPEEQVEPGHAYSIDLLIKYLIVNSDNTAYDILENYLGTFNYQPIYKVYFFLHFPFSDEFSRNGENISPKIYANTFIALYKSSFLNAEMSKKALTLLKQSQFSQGLVAGVPPEIEVAHKFGEREFINSDKKELHDCGIIFNPQNPYILCIMTKGTDLKEQANAISVLSQAVYEVMKTKRKI